MFMNSKVMRGSQVKDFSDITQDPNYFHMTRNLPPEMKYALDLSNDSEFHAANSYANSAFSSLSQYELENLEHFDLLNRLQQMVQGLNIVTSKLNRADLIIQLSSNFVNYTQEQYEGINPPLSSQIAQITGLLPKFFLLVEAAQEAMKTQAMADAITAQNQAISSMQNNQQAYQHPQPQNYNQGVSPEMQLRAQQFLQQHNQQQNISQNQTVAKPKNSSGGLLRNMAKGFFRAAKSAQPNQSTFQYKCHSCKKLQTYTVHPINPTCCGRTMHPLI